MGEKGHENDAGNNSSHLLNIYYVVDITVDSLCSWQPYFMMPIVQMRKLRLREVNWLAQEYTVKNWRSQDLIPKNMAFEICEKILRTVIP